MRERAMAKNVLRHLAMCCRDPLTGFYRTGKCETGADDRGQHTVCVEVTEEFHQIRWQRPSTPRPEFSFPGSSPATTSASA